MLRAFQYRLFERGGQPVEVFGVPPDADDQVFVPLRVDDGLPKHSLIHDVDLELHPTELEICKVLKCSAAHIGKLFATQF